MNLTFDPLAAKEYRDAFYYYEVREKGLGEKFRKAVWAAIEILEHFPEIGEEVRPLIHIFIDKCCELRLMGTIAKCCHLNSMRRI